MIKVVREIGDIYWKWEHPAETHLQNCSGMYFLGRRDSDLPKIAPNVDCIQRLQGGKVFDLESVRQGFDSKALASLEEIARSSGSLGGVSAYCLLAENIIKW
jgi:hypothetical protein